MVLGAGEVHLVEENQGHPILEILGLSSPVVLVHVYEKSGTLGRAVVLREVVEEAQKILRGVPAGLHGDVLERQAQRGRIGTRKLALAGP